MTTQSTINGRSTDLAHIDRLDFGKGDGLLPAIVQHADTGVVLMLGYMNREALEATRTRGRVVFFSRSRRQLWEKGETTGRTLLLEHIQADCDGDALLVSARPLGPVCHSGAATCFGEARPEEPLSFLNVLSTVIDERIATMPQASHTADLVRSGVRRVAQKVGEEGLEMALAGAGGTDDEVIGETADLLYHLLLLLRVRGLQLGEVLTKLRSRHETRTHSR